MDFQAVKDGIMNGTINETNLSAKLNGLQGWRLALLRFLISTVP